MALPSDVSVASEIIVPASGSTRSSLSASLMQVRAFWTVGAGQGALLAETLAGDGVLVTTLASGISRGTEALVFAGRVPPSQYEAMRAPLMGGAFPFPVKYGYAMVGRVEQGPNGLMQGRTVFALHPHQTLFDVPADGVTPVPDGVPPRRAVLAANMETALNAVWDAAPGPADRIAIVGAGVVGALVAYLCGRLPGAQVTLIDIDASRAECARGLIAIWSFTPAAALPV